MMGSHRNSITHIKSSSSKTEKNVTVFDKSRIKNVLDGRFIGEIGRLIVDILEATNSENVEG